MNTQSPRFHMICQAFAWFCLFACSLAKKHHFAFWSSFHLAMTTDMAMFAFLNSFIDSRSWFRCDYGCCCCVQGLSLNQLLKASPRLRRRFGRGKAQRWCQKCRVEARHEIILKLSRDFDVLQSWRLYLKQWGKIRDASTAQQKGGASCSFKRTNCTWQHWLSNNVTFDTSFDKILQNTLCSQ